MAKDEFKYEEALRQLEHIVEQMENDELDIDVMGEQLKRAQKLIKKSRRSWEKRDNARS